MTTKVKKRLLIISLIGMSVLTLSNISRADLVQIDTRQGPPATEPIGSTLPSAQPFTPESYFMPLARPADPEPGILEKQKLDEVARERATVREDIEIKRERSDPSDVNRAPIVYKNERIIRDDKLYSQVLEINNIIEQQRAWGKRQLNCD